MISHFDNFLLLKKHTNLMMILEPLLNYFILKNFKIQYIFLL